MSSIFAITQSGMQVASLRLAVSANDVANVQTAGHVPSRVEALEREDGGVSGRVVQENDPAFEARLDRAIAGVSGTDAADAGRDTEVAMSGTNLEREMVEQISASAAFRANLASLRSADETLEMLMRVKS